MLDGLASEVQPIGLLKNLNGGAWSYYIIYGIFVLLSFQGVYGVPGVIPLILPIAVKADYAGREFVPGLPRERPYAECHELNQVVLDELLSLGLSLLSAVWV